MLSPNLINIKGIGRKPFLFTFTACMNLKLETGIKLLEFNVDMEDFKLIQKIAYHGFVAGQKAAVSNFTTEDETITPEIVSSWFDHDFGLLVKVINRFTEDLRNYMQDFETIEETISHSEDVTPSIVPAIIQKETKKKP
jgi:hypothetical protein